MPGLKNVRHLKIFNTLNWLVFKNNIFIRCRKARKGLFSIEMTFTFRKFDRTFKVAEKLKAKFGVEIDIKF
jgi:hypothetical protein